MMARDKVIGLENLASTLMTLRSEGKKVVHCHGVFDMLHIGHIRHFEHARKMGDVLVVTVTPDVYVNKGPHRPVFGESLRAEAIAALDCTDYVAINKWPTSEETIALIRPDFYVKGSDYRNPEADRTGGIVVETAAIAAVGGRLVFTDDITFSSSNLINQHMEVFPAEVSQYLADFSAGHSTEEVLRYLDGAATLSVLVVGESIIDEYVYCETLGKSGKDPVLATRRVSEERFAGGTLAVANHVSAFSDNVGVLTFLGGRDSHEEFIRERLDSRIDKMFLYMGEDCPTIVKKRFVEVYPFQKLFELYVMESDEARPTEVVALCAKLSEILPSYDVVVVTDYGHGMLGPEAVEMLCAEARFLALNTQVNAGNQGFNTVSKYERADFICVSERELRLDARSHRGDLRDLVLRVADRLSCKSIIITRGEHGSLCFGRDEGFFEVPGFAVRVTDRLGAGDAVLSVAALCAAQRSPIEIAGFVGNAVGAQAVATVGNRASTERLSLVKYIESLLK